MIKIFAGIGMGWVLYVAYILLKCSWERIKRWRKTGCKVKMLCKPHIYDFNFLWHGDGELTLKCKKCGKVKRLYVDVESFKGVFDKV
nr:MAG TPA: baseplate protein [Caudoviricetes sp.]